MTSMENFVFALWIAMFVLGIGIIIRSTTAQKIHSEAIRNLKNRILGEIEGNERLLDIGYHENRYGHKMYVQFLFREVFDSAKSNDSYISISAQIQETLSYYYGGINRWNVNVNKLDGEQRAVKRQEIFNEQDALKALLRKATTDLKQLLIMED